MKKETFVFGIHEIEKTALHLHKLLNTCCIFTFTGPLGAGKTTLIQALLRAADVHSVITSPTFTYVNVYKNEVDQTFYHFDLYRLMSLQEFIDLGFEEYLYKPQSWVFIEWPELIFPLLEREVCNVTLDCVDELLREITIEVIL